MCPSCFEKDIDKFKTQLDFEEFETIIDSKVNDELIKILEDKKFWTNNYVCNTCNEHWILSVPDNAWRGYFLPKEKAISYESRIDKSRSGLGCLIVMAVIVVIIVLMTR